MSKVLYHNSNKINLLAVGEDMDDLRTFYLLFLKALNLMAAEKPSSLFSLETMAFPPQFDCSPHPPPYIASTVS